MSLRNDEHAESTKDVMQICVIRGRKDTSEAQYGYGRNETT